MTRRLYIGAMAIALTIAAMGVARAFEPGDVIYACVAERTGTIKIVGEADVCAKGAERISWNRQGPPGPTGDPGATGAPGASGAPGTIGALDDLKGKPCGTGTGSVSITYGSGPTYQVTLACKPAPTPTPTPTPTPPGSIVHLNGFGGTYLFASPLGTPGEGSTYSQQMAMAAAQSWFVGAGMYLVTCDGASALRATGASGFITIWVYAGSLAGHVQESSSSFEICPAAASRTWN